MPNSVAPCTFQLYNPPTNLPTPAGSLAHPPSLPLLPQNSLSLPENSPHTGCPSGAGISLRGERERDPPLFPLPRRSPDPPSPARRRAGRRSCSSAPSQFSPGARADRPAGCEIRPGSSRSCRIPVPFGRGGGDLGCSSGGIVCFAFFFLRPGSAPWEFSILGARGVVFTPFCLLV